MNPIHIKGHMSAELVHQNGEVERQEKDNIIVNVGFDFIANSMCLTENRPAAMQYIAIGTGTAPTADGQTLLGTVIAINNATYSHSALSKTFSLATTFGPGVGTGAITEAGVFNAASGGIMLDRVVFDPINKAANDTLNVHFTFTLS